MKAKVLIEFTDKLTRKRHLVGTEYEGPQERCEELAKRGIISKVEVKETTVVATDTEPSTEAVDQPKRKKKK